jgi:hypothetical protein
MRATRDSSKQFSTALTFGRADMPDAAQHRALQTPVWAVSHPLRAGTLAEPPLNWFVLVNQRKREFEAKNAVTSRNLPWLREVTLFLISKRRYWTRSVA